MKKIGVGIAIGIGIDIAFDPDCDPDPDPDADTDIWRMQNMFSEQSRRRERAGKMPTRFLTVAALNFLFSKAMSGTAALFT